MMKKTILFLVAIAFSAGTNDCFGQQGDSEPDGEGVPAIVKQVNEIGFKTEKFSFVRIQYDDKGQRRRWRSYGWSTDYPDADLGFTAQFHKVTGMECEKNGKILKLTDPGLSDEPFIYIAEGGRMELKDEEIKSLRGYLLNGGFLMLDDFWGEAEWDSVAAEFRRVFPDRKPVDLPLSHEIFNCFYEISEKPQVPNVALGAESEHTGITWEREDGKEPHYRALIDDSGRVMVIFCHNTDLGDGWERREHSEYYSREFSQKKAFPMGINIVVYALSH